MAHPTTRHLIVYDAYTPNRRVSDLGNGWSGDKHSNYTYSRTREFVRGRHKYKYGNFWLSLDAGNAPGVHMMPLHKRQSTYNLAYKRFMSKIRPDSSMLGVTLAEYSQSANMVRGRAQALYWGTRRLFNKWTKMVATKQDVPRRFADYWLEYSFGWSANLGDIHNGMKVLCSDPPAKNKAKGTASEYEDGEFDRWRKWHTKYRVACFATVTVVNPNLYLLNSLGLLNPAQIIWEKVKWSFVLDWLFDIGSCISAWTDHFGLKMEGSGTSTSSLTTLRWEATNDWEGVSSSVSLIAERTFGVALPLPNFDIGRNIGSNLKRAANAISLTTQLINTPAINRRLGGR